MWSDRGRKDSHSDRIVGAALHICRRLDLAVVIDAAAVVQLQGGIHKGRCVGQGGGVVLAAVDLLDQGRRLERALLTLGGVVGDAAIAKGGLGHSHRPRRIGRCTGQGPGPLRGKERCFAMRWANSNGVCELARPGAHTIQRFILQCISSIARLFIVNILAIPLQTFRIG